MEEKDLILLAKTGDKNAFCRLYDLYKNRLYRYAFYKLGNEQDAEDAVQDCVISAFTQIGSLKKPEAFTAWIFRILYCSCSAAAKAQMNRNRNDSIDDMTDTLCDNTMESAISKTELQQALEILKDNEKEIVLLSVVAGFSSREIGKITDMTSGAVRSKLSRSLKKMRDFLE